MTVYCLYLHLPVVYLRALTKSLVVIGTWQKPSQEIYRFECRRETKNYYKHKDTSWAVNERTVIVMETHKIIAVTDVLHSSRQ